MMSAASSVLNRVLTGTSTPPAVSSPNAAMIHSAELGAQIATRSPLPMPRSAKAPAAQRIRSASSRERQPQRTVDDRFRIAEAVAAVRTISGMVCQLAGRHTVRTSRGSAHDLAWSSTGRCDSALM